jgi:purine-cytosine permease-like protein
MSKNNNNLNSVVPVSIVGAHRFYITITNFLGLIGYWTSMYTSIILVEHLYFRNKKNDPNSLYYDTTAWNVPKRLPSGIAAGAASVLTFGGVVVPCMNQVWFRGVVGRVTGDIGFEASFVVGGLVYFLFRWIEIRCGRGVL